MIRQQEAALNQMIHQGQHEEALARFYTEDALLGENDCPPTRGKAANLERESSFFSEVKSFQQTLLASAVDGNTSFSLWAVEVEHERTGIQHFKQVSVRRWRDQLVESEIFYYGKDLGLESILTN